ncbi:MAG: hypothetical protein QOJ34_2004, partial [Pseudonocardiales bacterium]|nr:hypothetical protein [Pseudonocardiales bacterium]
MLAVVVTAGVAQLALPAPARA